jgi:hypothetical protein
MNEMIFATYKQNVIVYDAKAQLAKIGKEGNKSMVTHIGILLKSR